MDSERDEELPGDLPPPPPPPPRPFVPWWRLFTDPSNTTYTRDGWRVMRDIVNTICEVWLVVLLAAWLFVLPKLVLPPVRTHANSWDYQLATSVSTPSNLRVTAIPGWQRGWSQLAYDIFRRVCCIVHDLWVRFFEATVCVPWDGCKGKRMIAMVCFITLLTLCALVDKNRT